MKGEDVRSTSSSRSGRCSRPFFRLSVIFCLSRSCCLDWSALPFPSAVFAPLPVSRSFSPLLLRALGDCSLSLSNSEKRQGTYGAAVVSSKICRFFRSCASGRWASRFSSESRRSGAARAGEMGVSSTVVVGSDAIVFLSFFLLRRGMKQRSW